MLQVFPYLAHADIIQVMIRHEVSIGLFPLAKHCLFDDPSEFIVPSPNFGSISLELSCVSLGIDKQKIELPNYGRKDSKVGVLDLSR